MAGSTPVTGTAVITGVGRRRGIGAGLAAGLAADGWDLVLSSWSPYDTRLGYEGAGEDPAAPADLLAEAGRRLGPVSALVMSHCESVDSDVLTTTVESFDRHYAVNVRASWLLVKAFAEQLPESGGSVVALTSDHTVGNLPYGATKGALDRLVLAAAHELAGRGLRANVVNPGPVDTGWMEPAWRAELTAQQPTGRLGTPADIADTVRFLLSDQGRWVTGQLLYVNGGFPLGRLRA